ncbi:hypothetical protein D3C73_1015850 [compost metagenome]
MVVISEDKLNNIILFPKTLDYYEQELTRFLQTEAYGEAQQLLTLLLQFHHLPDRQLEQWKALLEWLKTMFTQQELDVIETSNDESETEEELIRQYVSEQVAHHAEYPKRLIHLLREGQMAQQMMALEQLAYIDHPQISSSIREWLAVIAIHPHIQFKALQTLKLLGERGSILLPRIDSNSIPVEIGETPLNVDHYPAVIREMIQRVGEISAKDAPDFRFFAEQTWNDFLAYTYGTAVYKELLMDDQGHVDLWASALHAVLQEILFGQTDPSECIELYGITEGMLVRWERAYTVIKQFTSTHSPLHE